MKKQKTIDILCCDLCGGESDMIRACAKCNTDVCEKHSLSYIIEVRPHVRPFAGSGTMFDVGLSTANERSQFLCDVCSHAFEKTLEDMGFSMRSAIAATASVGYDRITTVRPWPTGPW